MLMTAADYRESLRRLSPRVFIDGQRVASVADEPLLAPGIAGVGVTYDFAHIPAHAALMTARREDGGRARQPDAAYRRDDHRPPAQARGGAAGLPGIGLRPALSRP